jgi:hypothetical protein
MKLRKGQRVQMTAEAVAKLQPREGRTVGTVRGLTQDGQYLRVHRDGMETTDTYEPGFWEPLEEARETPV